MKIVIVEDELRIREGITKLLSRISFRTPPVVKQATSGEDGLILIKEFSPDVVITDIRMDKMTGIEMLHTLKNGGYIFESVILSAYEDFSYAKEAIHLGVNRYLVKPIDLDDFISVIEEVKEKIYKQKTIEGNLKTTPLLLSDLLSVNSTVSRNAEIALRSHFKNESIINIAVLAFYVESDIDVLIDLMSKILNDELSENWCLINFRSEKYLIFNLFLKNDTLTLKPVDILNTLIKLQYDITKTAVGIISNCYYNNYGIKLKQLVSDLDYKLSNNNKVFVEESEISKTKYQSFLYPTVEENEMLKALARKQILSTIKHSKHFLEIIIGKGYCPEKVKKASVKYLLSASYLLKESGDPAYTYIDEADIISKTMVCVTPFELTNVVLDFFDKITVKGIPKENTIVAKAKKIIEEDYSKGINLTDVALALNLSPEHISALFSEHEGTNFSNYMRDFRLNCAKNYLNQTNLKIYEIAELIGYRDTKYFTRVFRDVVGCTPVVYRNRKK